MNVVFGCEAVAAEGVQRLRDRLRGGVAVPPCCQRNGGGGFLRTVGDVANGFPYQQLGAVDIAQPVGERMGNGLERTDELPELFALAGISRCEFDCFAPKTCERRRNEELPFLDGLRKELESIRARTQNDLRLF